MSDLLEPTDVNPNRYPKHVNSSKGQVFGGECNRTACYSKGATYWNMGTYGLYCRWCALYINAAEPRRLVRPPLCVEVTEKPKLETHETLQREKGYYDIFNQEDTVAKTVRLVRVKETPGTYQYKEVDDDGKIKLQTDSVIGSLYLRKDKMKKLPKILIVKLMSGDDYV